MENILNSNISNICKDAALAKGGKALEEYGWITCYSTIFDSQLIDAHTHGLPENLNHVNLQIVAPLDKIIVHTIFSTLVNRIKKGESFKVGMRVSGIIMNFDVTFIEVYKESAHIFLRVILPDRHGHLSEDNIEGIFKKQFDLPRP